MPLFLLRDQKKGWLGGVEQTAMWRGGQQMWEKSAAAPPPEIEDFYGTDVGQVRIHLDPDNAVLGSSQQVTSVPNTGGGGATYNSTKAGSGNITVANHRFQLSASGQHLNMANSFDLKGHHIFFAVRIDTDLAGNVNMMGANLSTSAGDRTNIQMVRSSGAANLLRWTGTSMQSGSYGMGEPYDNTLVLLEYAWTGATRTRFWHNGIPHEDKATPWANFKLKLFGLGYNTPGVKGELSDFVAMVADESQLSEDRAVLIRQALARKHGITLEA